MQVVRVFIDCVTYLPAVCPTFTVGNMQPDMQLTSRVKESGSELGSELVSGSRADACGLIHAPNRARKFRYTYWL